jgi:hypothetical protein
LGLCFFTEIFSAARFEALRPDRAMEYPLPSSTALSPSGGKGDVEVEVPVKFADLSSLLVSSSDLGEAAPTAGFLSSSTDSAADSLTLSAVGKSSIAVFDNSILSANCLDSLSPSAEGAISSSTLLSCCCFRFFVFNLITNFGFFGAGGECFISGVPS